MWGGVARWCACCATLRGSAGGQSRRRCCARRSSLPRAQGRSREEAFRIGAEIAAAVTAANPSPVTLKMEKVYHPCILQTKKRYVGFAYESPSQAAPIFDAKVRAG